MQSVNALEQFASAVEVRRQWDGLPALLGQLTNVISKVEAAILAPVLPCAQNRLSCQAAVQRAASCQSRPARCHWCKSRLTGPPSGMQYRLRMSARMGDTMPALAAGLLEPVVSAAGGAVCTTAAALRSFVLSTSPVPTTCSRAAWACESQMQLVGCAARHQSA